MKLPWIIRRMRSYVDEVVIEGGRSHDHTVDDAPALPVDAVQVQRDFLGAGQSCGRPQAGAGTATPAMTSLAGLARGAVDRRRQGFTD